MIRRRSCAAVCMDWAAVVHPKPLVVQVDAGSGTIKLVGLVNSLSDVGVRPAAAPCSVAIAAVPCHSCHQCTHIVLSSGERRKCAGRRRRRRMAQHDQGVASAAAVTGPYRDDDPSHARNVYRKHSRQEARSHVDGHAPLHCDCRVGRSGTRHDNAWRLP